MKQQKNYTINLIVGEKEVKIIELMVMLHGPLKKTTVNMELRRCDMVEVLGTSTDRDSPLYLIFKWNSSLSTGSILFEFSVHIVSSPQLLQLLSRLTATK